MKTARLIITFDCPRDCSYCCNKYTTILNGAIEISNLDHLNKFEAICITGGEPLLNPERTLGIVKKLRENNPSAIIYMYTAYYHLNAIRYVDEILDYIDGIHYTLHEKSTLGDIKNFELFQTAIFRKINKSFRLYIHNKINKYIMVNPLLWTRIESKEWIKEDTCELPKHETLFKLKGEY
jgi:organic radical activating enzyme